MTELILPTDEATVRELNVGDFVEITGIMFTGRDSAHTYLVEEFRPDYRKMLEGRIIYHCGPVVKKENGEWKFISAGPTTSIREEPYQAEVFERYGVRAAMGKGGMGKRTLEGCGEFGAVYLHAVGGAGALAAASVKRVTNVYMLEEFGVPEAFWEIEVERFPAVVTMDSKGRSLHDGIRSSSRAAYEKLMDL